MVKPKKFSNHPPVTGRSVPWLYSFRHQHRFWFYGLFLAIGVIGFPLISHGDVIAHGLQEGSSAFIAVASGHGGSTPTPLNPGDHPVTIAATGFLFFAFFFLAVMGILPSVSPFQDAFLLSPEGRSQSEQKTEFATAKKWLMFTLCCGAFCLSMLGLLMFELAFKSQANYINILFLAVTFLTIVSNFCLIYRFTKISQKLRKNANHLGLTILNIFVFAIFGFFSLVTLLLANGMLIFLRGEEFTNILFGLHASYILVNGTYDWFFKSFDRKLPQCEACRRKMFRVNPKIVNKYLSHPQKIAKYIESTRFEGWHCHHCHHNDFSQLHLRGFVHKKRNQYPSECPRCETFTLVRKAAKIITKSTTEQEGLQWIKYHCVACRHDHEKQEIIPRITSSTGASSAFGVSSGGGGGCGGGC